MRAIFVIGAFVMGAGTVVYGIAWLLLPDEHGRIALEDALRGQFHAALFGALALMLLGLDHDSRRVRAGGGHFELGIPWWFILGSLALLLGAFDHRRRRLQVPRRVPTVPAGPTPFAAPAAATPPTPPLRRGSWPGRRGPGFALVAGTVGLASLAGVATYLTSRSVHRNTLMSSRLAFAVAVVVIGLGIVTAGVRGRRVGAGWLIPPLLLVTLPVGVHPNRVGDAVVRVTELKGQRISTTVGHTTVDLRRAVRGSHTGPTPQIDLMASIGDVTVDYPGDLALDVIVRRRLGTLEGAPREGRVGRRDGPPDVRVVLDGGVGGVAFEEVAR